MCHSDKILHFDEKFAAQSLIDSISCRTSADCCHTAWLAAVVGSVIVAAAAAAAPMKRALRPIFRSTQNQ